MTDTEGKRTNLPTHTYTFVGLTDAEKLILTQRGTYVDDGNTTTATLRGQQQSHQQWFERRNLDAKLSN